MLRTICLSVALLVPLFSNGDSFFSPQKSSQARQIQIKVNDNVELLGFVYFLGYEGRQSETDPKYSAKNKERYAYGLNLYRRYKKFENSPHLAIAVGFAENIWLDYFIALLLQLDDFPNASLNRSIPLRYYVRFSPTRDSIEARNNAEAFIDAMNGLYKEVDFGSYINQSRQLYKNAISQVETGMPEGRFISEMEAFYQGHFDAYALLPSLTIPTGMGFGISYNKAQQSNAVHVFGAFAPPSFDDTSKLDMGFLDKQHLLELSTHEFGHSFVNPAVEQLPPMIIKDTERLYDPIREAMSNQAYTQWKSCLSEHFVRAGEVIIARNLGNKGDSERLKNFYIDARKFIYLPILLTELEKYNNKRNIPYKQVVEQAMEMLVKSTNAK